MSKLQTVKYNDKLYGKVPTKALSYTLNTNVITESGQIEVIRNGNIVIVNISAALKNMPNWEIYNLMTLPIKSTGRFIGTLVNQNSNLPITIQISKNENVVKALPCKNTFTNEDWYRGQLVFVTD